MVFPVARALAGDRRTCVASLTQWRERTSSNQCFPPNVVAIFNRIGSKPSGSPQARRTAVRFRYEVALDPEAYQVSLVNVCAGRVSASLIGTITESRSLRVIMSR